MLFGYADTMCFKANVLISRTETAVFYISNTLYESLFLETVIKILPTYY